jgi:hypothetical protein
MKEAESAAKTMAANALKGRVNWNKYPKLAAIFEHRPTVNVYWHELVTLMRDELQETLRRAALQQEPQGAPRITCTCVPTGEGAHAQPCPDFKLQGAPSCVCAWGDKPGPWHTRSCPRNPAYDVTPVYDEPQSAPRVPCRGCDRFTVCDVDCER